MPGLNHSVWGHGPHYATNKEVAALNGTTPANEPASCRDIHQPGVAGNDQQILMAEHCERCEVSYLTKHPGQTNQRTFDNACDMNAAFSK